jgi:hypothetical protein
MTTISKIRKALKGIMSEGEANACRIEKAYLYDGSQQRNGWHFTRFGSTPTYLGNSANEAIETIEQIKEERKSYR